MRTEWPKKILHWEDNKNHYYSIVFTWDLFKWAKEIQPELDGRGVIVGGPAIKLMPELIPDWIKIGNDMPVLHRHNSLAVKTSTGCLRSCGFCAVPKTEGKLKELDTWEIKPIVIDNNLLACSKKHIIKVFADLKKLKWCDFNQGLDCRLLNKHYAELLAGLNNPIIRLAFDNVKYESDFLRAYQLLRNAGIPKRKIRVYVLIGYKDNPEDALYRLNLIHNLGLVPFPMRFQSISSKKKNEYIGANWTHKELDRFTSYWSNLRYVGSVPFIEYVHNIKNINYQEKQRQIEYVCNRAKSA